MWLRWIANTINECWTNVNASGQPEIGTHCINMHKWYGTMINQQPYTRGLIVMQTQTRTRILWITL